MKYLFTILFFLVVFLTPLIGFTQNKELIEQAKTARKQADAHFKNKDYSDAFKSYSEEAAIWKKAKDLKNQAMATIFAGYALQNDDKDAKAIKELKEALEIGLKLKDNNIIGSCYGFLATSYQKTGDELKATEYYTNYKNFENYIENQQLKTQIKKNEKTIQTISDDLVVTSTLLDSTETDLTKTKATLRETEAIAIARKMQINLLNKEKRIQNLIIDKHKAEIENQKLFRNFIILCLAFITLIAVFAIFAYIQKQKDNKTIHKQNEKIFDSMTYANKIQSAMLPELNWIKKSLPEMFIFFKPLDIISGDFYFFSDSDEEGAVYFAVVDCTGHGVPGALMSMIGSNSLNEIILNGEKEVNKILDKLHDKIVFTLQQDATSNKEGMDIALCKISKNHRIVEYSGARNPLLIVESGKLKMVSADRRPIGGVYRRKFEPFTKHILEINQSTMIYLFTDGFSDQFGGEKSRKFYTQNMFNLLEKISVKSPNEQEIIIKKEFEAWKGNSIQIDDICVAGIRLTPK